MGDTPILDTPILDGTDTGGAPLQGILITTAEEDAPMLDSTPAITPSHGILITTADDDAEARSNDDIHSLSNTQSLSDSHQNTGSGADYSTNFTLMANSMIDFTDQASAMTDQDGTSEPGDNQDNQDMGDGAHLSTNVGLMLNSIRTSTDETTTVANQDGTTRVSNSQNTGDGASSSTNFSLMVNTMTTPTNQTTVMDDRAGTPGSSTAAPFRPCRFILPDRLTGHNASRDHNVENPSPGESSSMGAARPISRYTSNGMANSTTTSASQAIRAAEQDRRSRISTAALFRAFGSTLPGRLTGHNALRGYNVGNPSPGGSSSMATALRLSRYTSNGMANSTTTSTSQAIPMGELYETFRSLTAPVRRRVILPDYLLRYDTCNNFGGENPPPGELSSMAPTQPPLPDSNCMIKCTCCQEDIPFIYCMYADCNRTRHAWCRECLERKFTASCADASQFPARCCQGRNSSFNLQEASFLLSADTLQKYTQKIYEAGATNATHCADAACGAFIRPHNIRGVVATCQSCLKETCTLCKHKMHERHSDEANGNCVGNPGEDGLIAAAQDNGWRKCEGCQIFVERASGCNHIVYV